MSEVSQPAKDEKAAPEQKGAVDEGPETKEPTKSPFWHSPYFWFMVVGLIAIPLMRPLTQRYPKAPPVFGALPAFQLVDQEGKPYGRSNMKGDVHIVMLFVTRCPTICPKMIKAMKRLRKGFAFHKMPVKMLSITVDPGHDTPKILRAYRKKFGIKGQDWRFLTSKDEAAVMRLARQGLKTAVNRPKKLESMFDISHSGKLILVDRKGRIRGYYSTTKQGLNEAFHRTQHVVYKKFHQ